jgi:circadian clock protein KaiB
MATAQPESVVSPAVRCALSLYVSGASLHADVVDRARTLSTEAGADLEVIDVLDAPDLARDEGIIATPTLVKRTPPPDRRVIGDLTDAASVRETLGL